MKPITLRIAITLLVSSLALQSYQCSSPEFTTAKTKFNNRDFAGANEYLAKEVEKNPGNVEAWILLARTRKAITPPDFQGAADALVEAEKRATSQTQKDEAGRESYYLWADLFNAGVKEYNDFYVAPEKNDPLKVSSIFDMAAKLRPENSEVYVLSASVHQEKGDTNRAVQYLMKYVEESKDNYDFAVAKKISTKSTRAEALAILGQPVSTKGQKYGKDSVLADKYKLDGKDVYVFSVQNAENTFIVDGWRNGAPAGRTEAEKERYTVFNPRPYLQLAVIYFEKKDYATALKYIDFASALNPTDEQITDLRVRIYEAQGKTADVLKSYEQLLQTDPNNVSNRINYGTVLNKIGNFDKAIEQFEKALAADPNNDLGLYNIAASYKNKASESQKAEKQKTDANPKYKEDETQYFPNLKKSAEYFERYKNLPAHRTDFAPLQQLANIYEVTRDKKLKTIMAELEAIEYANENNEAYYNLMGSLYTKQNQIDKAKTYYAKADALKK